VAPGASCKLRRGPARQRETVNLYVAHDPEMVKWLDGRRVD